MKTGFLLITFSAIMESFWNIALKKSNGLFDWPVNIFGMFFLIIGIITFKKGIETVSLSIATVIWSGISLLFTIALDKILYKTRLDTKVAFFMVLAIVSIIALSYYSQTNES